MPRILMKNSSNDRTARASTPWAGNFVFFLRAELFPSRGNFSKKIPTVSREFRFDTSTRERVAPYREIPVKIRRCFVEPNHLQVVRATRIGQSDVSISGWRRKSRQSRRKFSPPISMKIVRALNTAYAESRFSSRRSSFLETDTASFKTTRRADEKNRGVQSTVKAFRKKYGKMFTRRPTFDNFNRTNAE